MSLGKLHPKKHPTKGERKYNNTNDPSLSRKHKNPKGVTKGQRNKLCFRAPLVIRSILEKEREGELESAISLEKPSLAMMTLKNRSRLHSLQVYQHSLPYPLEKLDKKS